MTPQDGYLFQSTQVYSKVKPLNILNLSTTSDGGAGLAAKEFNRFLLECGYNSKLVVKESRRKESGIIILEELSQVNTLRFAFYKIKNKTKSLCDKFIIGRTDNNFSFFNSNENRAEYTAEEILKKTPFNPDIIIIHWVAWFLNSKTILDLYQQTNAKIFWVMMDNAPLTGGCHYSWDCEGYISDCQDCPAIIKDSKKKTASHNLQIKKEKLPDCVELIACSQPDYLKAVKSSLFFNRKIHKLILPVDERLFFSSEERDAKKAHLKLPAPDSLIILFGSLSIIEKRKGLVNLISALHKVKRLLSISQKNKIHLAIIGNKLITEDYELPFEYTLLGYIPYNKLPDVFQVADVFVSPSIEDSGPLMINQSLMCGTPVVSFNIGVAVDLVINGITGYQADTGNTDDLALGLYNILIKEKTESLLMRDNCRQFAIKNFSFNASKEITKSILNGSTD